MPAPEIALLLRILDEAYNRKSWHGTNLRGSIRGLSIEQAAFRPAPGRHNIWEIVLHAAYWKYTVRRRILDEPRGSFALKGSNWFERPEESDADDAAWRRDVKLLDETHRTLRDAVAGLTPARLEERQPGKQTTLLSLVTGIAAHDLYHAGQIQLIKRLQA